MRTKYSVALGVVALAVLAVLGLLTFAAGGIVARHHITPFVGVVNAAEANVKALVKSLKGESSKAEYLTTAYYHLKISTYPTSDTGAGDNIGFARLADGYLIGQRAGALKFARLDQETNQVSVQPLTVTVPTNKNEFLATAPDANRWLQIQFGVKDIFIQDLGDDLRLFASHQYWYPDRQCAVLRLSVLRTTASSLLDGDARDDWHRVYESQPCLALNNKLDQDGNDNAFLQSGGRLDLLNDDTLLITVGEHFQDSIHNENLVQDPSASYGKIFKIHLRGDKLRESTATMLSIGHRNPQGLFVDSEGNIWSTEHGPRGGDELNLVVEGANYGWPFVSYGTDYKGVVWPDHLDWAGHEGYQKPVLAWLPSIGINNLIRVRESGFPLWDGDLLIGSLKDQALHRVMLDGMRVVARERIPIGSRIRDLMQTEDNKLLLLSDDGKLILIDALDNADPAQMPAELKAAKLWVQCESCHSVAPGGGHSVGPNLNGIIGSDIARFGDYNYSRALSGVVGNWTPERLDAFLTSPQEFAPGTKMAFAGVKDPEERKLIIQYLQAQ